jgi:transposase-like protein
MATLEEFQFKGSVQRSRYFSDEFKRRKVDEVEKRLTSIAEICRVYNVSKTAVYRWIYKYSIMKKKGVRLVVEAQSDTARIKALQDRIAQLEQMVGQKEFEIDFLKKQMDIASDQYGVDFKKKHSGKRSSGSGNAEDSTPIK